jgi:membrane protein implicated in regulation of membrane protease activity
MYLRLTLKTPGEKTNQCDRLTLTLNIRFIPRLFPLTYSAEALNISVLQSSASGIYLIDIAVMALFSVALLVLAAPVLRKKTT